MHVVAEEAQHAHERVADDGRAQVADVHLLGDVRAPSSRPRSFCLCSASGTPSRARSARHLGERAAEPVAAQAQVDEAGPGDLGARDRFVLGQRVGDRLRELARVRPSCLASAITPLTW